MKKIDRTGVEGINNQGLHMKIISYRSHRDIDVLFDDGYIKQKCCYSNFLIGQIKNPYFKSLYNVGCIGEGVYSSKTEGKMTKQYNAWSAMFNRCYSKKEKYNLSYIGCVVCEEWHNFQNFAKWYDENYYSCDNEKMNIDKDILKKGNKVYSPENCIFVPERINNLFSNLSPKGRGLPIGVMPHVKCENIYIASCLTEISNNKNGYIGSYKTTTEAFDAYKSTKEAFIKRVADDYKDKIPVKLYNAMYLFEVDAGD